MEIQINLKTKGWFLTQDGIEECSEGVSQPKEELIIKNALHHDLRDIGDSILANYLAKGKDDGIVGPLVLQVQKIRNVSAPKANETSQHAPQLLRVYLSDGHTYVSMLQTGQWDSLSLETPPGTKLLIKTGTYKLKTSFLVLTSNQFSVLGGNVTSLTEKWQVNRSMANKNRTHHNNGGPPPWVPFGQKILFDPDLMKKGLKSLEAEKEKESAKANDAFSQQRKNNIAEVAKAMDGKKKDFGKGKVEPRDNQSNYAANKHSNYNQKFVSNSEAPQRSEKFDRKPKQVFKDVPFQHNLSVPEVPERPERNERSGRRERGPPRDRDRNHDASDSTHPSKPTTLFDFLEMKLDLPEVPLFDKPQNPSLGNNNADNNDQYTKSLPRNLSQRNDSQFDPRNSHRHEKPQGQNYKNQYEDRRNRTSRNNFSDLSNSDDKQQHHSFREPRRDGNNSSNEGRSSFTRFSNHQSGDFQHFDGALSSNSHISNRFAQHSNRPVQTFNRNNAVSQNFLQNNSHFPELGNDTKTESPALRREAPKPNPFRNKPAVVTTVQKEKIQVDDIVMAKYWEDRKFYQALVHAISEDSPTCVVQFIEYGNFEEVLLADVYSSSGTSDEPKKEIVRTDPQVRSHNNGQHQRVDNTPFSAEGEMLNAGFKGTLEFRRGGYKPYVQNNAQQQSLARNAPQSPPIDRATSNDTSERHHQSSQKHQRNTNQRPTAQYYQPPPVYRQ